MSLPWAWYTDVEQFRREQERIFARAWQYAGHAGQAPEPGSLFTAHTGSTSIRVVRDREGALAGFSDGNPVQLATWGPFVFVNPDLDAGPLAEALGDVPQLVAELGIDVDALEFRLRTEFELAANWKIVCENFLECYHCPVAHPGFSKLVDVSPDSYRLEADGLTASQFGQLRHGTGEAYDAAGEIPRAQFHFVWPNLGLNIFPGRTNLSLGAIVPVSPGRTARSLDYFFSPAVDEAWVEELLVFDDQVGSEDRALVESVQVGVASGLIERGRVLPASERLVVHFQELTVAALT